MGCAHTLFMVVLCAFYLFGNSASLLSTSGNWTQPIVCLENPSVTFKGISSHSVESFLNIRFGQDTSGHNRFAHPKPYTYSQGSVVDASQPGAACPQQKVPVTGFPIFDDVTNISEDCLTLRVDRPARTSPLAKLPVMVYIFGGGFAIGQVYDSCYDPTGLVSEASRDGHPVIYVAMNYRVGFFGFASSPALDASDSLNAGLLDQRLALKWVQKHIAAFGGDPDNVTIFGESVGATSVGFHITAFGANVAKPPFRKAIMQSGAPTADIGTTSNISTVHTSELTKLVNCSSSISATELACLRRIPLSTLLPSVLAYQLSVNPFSGFSSFVPVAPSTFIPDSTSNLLASGRFAPGIDILTGWNENDGSLFVPKTLASDTEVAQVVGQALPGLSRKSIQDALALYPVSAFSPDPANSLTAHFFRASQITRDYEFTCPSVLMARANARRSPGASSYLFALNQTAFAPMYASWGAPYYAVSHFSDIPYVFNQAPAHYKGATPSDINLSMHMSSSWAAFATYGNPSKGRGTLPNWEDAVAGSSDDGNELDVLVVGGPDGGMRKIREEEGYEDLATRCAFWNSEDVLKQIGL